MRIVLGENHPKASKVFATSDTRVLLVRMLVGLRLQGPVHS